MNSLCQGVIDCRLDKNGVQGLASVLTYSSNWVSDATIESAVELREKWLLPS